MKRKTSIIISIIIILCIGFILGAHFYNKNYHENVKEHPQMYCYEYFTDTTKPVSVLIIKDLAYKEKYLEYYEKMERGEKAYINDFPIIGLPQYHPVYVMGYTEDGLLAEVISYYNRGARLGGSFLRGWVYAKTLHEIPPQKK